MYGIGRIFTGLGFAMNVDCYFSAGAAVENLGTAWTARVYSSLVTRIAGSFVSSGRSVVRADSEESGYRPGPHATVPQSLPLAGIRA